MPARHVILYPLAGLPDGTLWGVKLILSMALAGFSAFAQLTPAEIGAGWVSLFDGETLYGWTPEGKASWRVDNGAIVADPAESGWLRFNVPFQDYELRLEYRQAADGNSGVFLRSARSGAPHETGYELQIFEGHPKFPTGSLVNRLLAKKVKPAPDQWHRYEVRHVGARIIVKLDGRKILDGSDTHSLRGFFGLQVNKGKPIAFRAVAARPLGLTPIFNGKNLDGWQKVDAPRPRELPEWSVRHKLLHVEKGPGALETLSEYQDFVLQLDIRANSSDPARHPNSGVFFRGTPKGHWTGYESQIRNEFKDGDPTKPVDTGTGGIYFHVPTRRVVAKDNEFFTKTIVAVGRDISIWVNGYLTASWTDPHPEGKSPRNKQAILTPGPIALQAHDPTTNLDFRAIRVAKYGSVGVN